MLKLHKICFFLSFIIIYDNCCDCLIKNKKNISTSSNVFSVKNAKKITLQRSKKKILETYDEIIKEIYSIKSSAENIEETHEEIQKLKKKLNNITFFDDFREQINAYTSKIPVTPWAFGCGNKALVMYILHDPYIKFAVQYLGNHKKVKNVDTNKTFDEMVENPQTFKDEYHNCLVTLFRLLLKTYEELEKDDTDSSEHDVLWNQIQGLEYLSHFLCGTFRRGFAEKGLCFYNFLQEVYNILFISHILKEIKNYFFGIEEIYFQIEKDKQNLQNYYFANLKNLENLEKYILHEDYRSLEEMKYDNNLPKGSKNNCYNFFIYEGINNNVHAFNLYLVDNNFFIHDSFYQFSKDFSSIKEFEDHFRYKKNNIFCFFYSSKYCVVKKEFEKNKNLIKLNKNEDLLEWDSVIPLLSSSAKKVYNYYSKLDKKLQEKYWFRNLVIKDNNKKYCNLANTTSYKKEFNEIDVLKVDWDKTRLNPSVDLPKFRNIFNEYELFGSTKF